MNKINNKRRRDSVKKIEKVFLDLIQIKNIDEISVTDICKKADLNRTTFYSNYIDIYDLADKLRIKMVNDFLNLYSDEANKKEHSYDFTKLFKHIKDNQLFYKTYFKLNFDLSDDTDLLDKDELIKFYGDNRNSDYHIVFFKAGLNAIIKKWLFNDCKESPEEMVDVIKSEYNIIKEFK